MSLQEKEFFFPYFPFAFGAVLSLLTSNCCFSVYGMTIDTIFACFCEDCETNDGIDRPYFMSKNMMQLMRFSTKNFAGRGPQRSDNWEKTTQAKVFFES